MFTFQTFTVTADPHAQMLEQTEALESTVEWLNSNFHSRWLKWFKTELPRVV